MKRRLGVVQDRCLPPHQIVLEYEDADVELYIWIGATRTRSREVVLNADGIEQLDKIVREARRWLAHPDDTEERWHRRRALRERAERRRRTQTSTGGTKRVEDGYA